VDKATETVTKGYIAGELDLLAVLESAMARQPRVLKSGLPNLAFMRAANAALGQPDNEGELGRFNQLEFWLTLARELGLVSVVDDRLTTGPEADEFFAMPAPQRCERLRNAWLNSIGVNEFALAPGLELTASRKGRSLDTGSDVPDVDTLRRARRTLLALLPETGSVRVADFVRDVQRHDRNLFIDHDDDASWRNVFYRGIRLAGEREDAERNDNWEFVEGAVIRLCAELPLSRLGYVDYDPAAETISAPAPHDQPPDFEIIVQANFEVMVLGDRPDVQTLWRLASFCTPDHDERVRRYRLERQPFARALGEGHVASELTDYLAGLSRTPLPQNVVFSLRDWSELAERIKVWPDALFIEAEGVEELSRLLPAELVERLAPKVIDGRHYVTPAPDISELRAILPPRRTVWDYSRRLPPVIEPGDGLALRAPRELLHLRARQVLALVSDSRGTDTYELSATLVRETAARLGAKELMHRLRTALARPLSAPVALALGTWSDKFPAPYVGEAEILVAEHPDQAALIDELPDVQQWVQRRLGRGVYLLKPGGSAPVRKALTGLD
jgi:hypothetical protein